MDEAALAALRVAAESVSLEPAADAAGLDVSALRALLQRYATAGLLVAA